MSMKVEVATAQGPVLDWMVAKCVDEQGKRMDWTPPSYSSSWAQGGPIIEREKIELKYLGYDNPPYWGALRFSPSKYERQAAVGPTPLIAAMRCYVTSKLGDEVEVPDGLTTQGEKV